MIVRKKNKIYIEKNVKVRKLNLIDITEKNMEFHHYEGLMDGIDLIKQFDSVFKANKQSDGVYGSDEDRAKTIENGIIKLNVF